MHTLDPHFPLTFYQNIRQEPYIVNQYVRPNALPVSRLEVIQTEQEAEYQKRKLVYQMEQDSQVRLEMLKNQNAIIRGAMIREGAGTSNK